MEGAPMLMKKAAYGLVQAPLHCNYLASLGYTRLQTEPCCWIFKDKLGEVKSIIHGHVDDLLLAGGETCPHKDLIAKLSWLPASARSSGPGAASPSHPVLAPRPGS